VDLRDLIEGRLKLQNSLPRSRSAKSDVRAAGIVQMVFAFVAQKPITNCLAIKGKGAQGYGWLERSKSIRGLWVITTDVVKRTVYDGLNIVSPGPGSAHSCGAAQIRATSPEFGGSTTWRSTNSRTQ
jgi:hypothetical protein